MIILWLLIQFRLATTICCVVGWKGTLYHALSVHSLAWPWCPFYYWATVVFLEESSSIHRSQPNQSDTHSLQVNCIWYKLNWLRGILCRLVCHRNASVGISLHFIALDRYFHVTLDLSHKPSWSIIDLEKRLWPSKNWLLEFFFEASSILSLAFY